MEVAACKAIGVILVAFIDELILYLALALVKRRYGDAGIPGLLPVRA